MHLSLLSQERFKDRLIYLPFTVFQIRNPDMFSSETEMYVGLSLLIPPVLSHLLCPALL
jgi:hypothetical protein